MGPLVSPLTAASSPRLAFQRARLSSLASKSRYWSTVLPAAGLYPVTVGTRQIGQQRENTPTRSIDSCKIFRILVFVGHDIVYWLEMCSVAWYCCIVIKECGSATLRQSPPPSIFPRVLTARSTQQQSKSQKIDSVQVNNRIFLSILSEILLTIFPPTTFQYSLSNLAGFIS